MIKISGISFWYFAVIELQLDMELFTF